MKKMYALLMCMTVCGAALFAQTEADFTTMAVGNGVVIAGYKGAGGDVVIPAAIGGKAVVGIGPAFGPHHRLTSVTIPEEVTAIHDYAFFHCAGLSSVTLPAGLTSIGREAFSGCKSLTSVTLPDSVTSIDMGAFYGCAGMETVTISASVTSIGRQAFRGCTSLKPEVRADIEKRFGKSVF